MIKILLLMLLSPLVCSGQTKPHVTQIQTVTNILALKALAPTEVTYVVVQGYTTTSDGGGGTFYFSPTETAADDGGHIIAPNVGTGRWVRDTNRKVKNVRHYGAVGDGVVTAVPYSAANHSGGQVSSYTGDIHEFSGTDDTIAINRAYRAVTSGDSLYFPSGNYRINGNSTVWEQSGYPRPGIVFIDKSSIVVRGDGPSSKLLIDFDSGGPTTIGKSFAVVRFLGCTSSVVKDIAIDFQITGWPGAPVSASDNDVGFLSAIEIAHSSTPVGGYPAPGAGLPSVNCSVQNVRIRQHHAWGNAFGDEYAPDKGAVKNFAIFVYGRIVSSPTSPTENPGVTDIMIKDTRIENVTIHDSQPYPIFLWMTDGSLVRSNTITHGGGRVPAIRIIQLNKNVLVDWNNITIKPRFRDGATTCYGIYISNDSGNFLPNRIQVINNRVTPDGTLFGGITVFSGNNISVTGNDVSGVNVPPGIITSLGLITTSQTGAWSGLGAIGQLGNVTIRGNHLRFGKNGIIARGFRNIVVDNHISGIASTALAITPVGQSNVSGNQINGAGIGVYHRRTITHNTGIYTATGTLTLSFNHISGCDIGTLSESAVGTTALWQFNTIRACATGSQGLTALYEHVSSNYYESNTTNLNAAGEGVATGTRTIGAGVLRGNPSKRFTP